MIRRVTLRALAVVVLLSVVALSAPGVSASWSYWTYGQGTDVEVWNSWTYYSTIRYVTYSPYGIWFQKEDGPSLQAEWWDCNFSAYGPVRDVSDADPAPGVFLKDNYTAPTYFPFCLAFRNASGNGYDTFTGELNWDG